MANEVVKVERLTIEKTAERLAVSPRQVRKLISCGELKAMMVSLNRNAKHKKYVIDLQDLEAFERSRQTGATEAPRKTPRRKKTEYPVYTTV